MLFVQLHKTVATRGQEDSGTAKLRGKTVDGKKGKSWSGFMLEVRLLSSITGSPAFVRYLSYKLHAILCQK